MATGNGARHADAATSHLLDESERHDRDATQRQREFAELLKDADEDDGNSEVAVAALGVARAALESQHDHDAPKSSSSSPPGAPWWVRLLPPRYRWIAALVAIAAALVALLQALAVFRGAAHDLPPAHPERRQAPP